MRGRYGFTGTRSGGLHTCPCHRVSHSPRSPAAFIPGRARRSVRTARGTATGRPDTAHQDAARAARRSRTPPRGANGRVWRLARTVDAKVLREVSEADVGANVVVVYKAIGRGTVTVAYALTRGETAHAYAARRFAVSVS